MLRLGATGIGSSSCIPIVGAAAWTKGDRIHTSEAKWEAVSKLKYSSKGERTSLVDRSSKGERTSLVERSSKGERTSLADRSSKVERTSLVDRSSKGERTSLAEHSSKGERTSLMERSSIVGKRASLMEHSLIAACLRIDLSRVCVVNSLRDSALRSPPAVNVYLAIAARAG
jgi:hypothetical protein